MIVLYKYYRAVIFSVVSLLSPNGYQDEVLCNPSPRGYALSVMENTLRRLVDERLDAYLTMLTES